MPFSPIDPAANRPIPLSDLSSRGRVQEAPIGLDRLDPSLNRPIPLSGLTALPGNTGVPFPPDTLYAGNGLRIVGAPELGAGDIWNRIGDTPFSAALGAIANQNPQAIKDAIRYDPMTGNYTVRLFDPLGRPVQVPVTQQDIADNLRRGGASFYDEVRDGVPGTQPAFVWPAVMEAAYAKLHDSNWNDGLDQGYAAIAKETTDDAGLRALTGYPPERIGYAPVPFGSKDAALDLLAGRVDAALANGRPVTLATKGENRSLLDIIRGRSGTQDGLKDDRSFTVERVYRDKNGEWQVRLHNPMPTGDDEGLGRSTPYITVPLKALVDTGGLRDFLVGPSPSAPVPDGTSPFPFPPGLFPFPLPSGGSDPSIF